MSTWPKPESSEFLCVATESQASLSSFRAVYDVKLLSSQQPSFPFYEQKKRSKNEGKAHKEAETRVEESPDDTWATGFS